MDEAVRDAERRESRRELRPATRRERERIRRVDELPLVAVVDLGLQRDAGARVAQAADRDVRAVQRVLLKAENPGLSRCRLGDAEGAAEEPVLAAVSGRGGAGPGKAVRRGAAAREHDAEGARVGPSGRTHSDALPTEVLERVRDDLLLEGLQALGGDSTRARR